MASLPVLSLALVLVFGMLCVWDSLAADPPGSSPAPAPEYGYDSVSLTPATVPAPSPRSISLSPAIFAESGYDAPSPTPAAVPAPSPDSLSPSPAFADASPPAPPPGDLASPSPSPVNANAPSGEFSPSPPAPAPGPRMAISDVTHDSADSANESDSGMSGGKKVGIAFGVISGACVVGLAAKVYKKRQENIRRAQFGYYAHGDML